MIERRNVSASLLAIATHYATAIALMFLLIYACSLTFVYIEGDDAASVAYHAMGRNSAVQKPYSPYHGMMDFFLGFFPPYEPLLRTAAMSVTAFGALGAFTLVFTLAFQRLPHLCHSTSPTLTAIAILLSVPEAFYLGLVYTPSVVALLLVLAAHWLVRFHLRTEQKFVLSSIKGNAAFWLSVLLFGVGTACRWDIGFYGLVITADLMLSEKTNGSLAKLDTQRVVYAFIWGCWAALATYAAITFSGYGFGDLSTILALSDKEISRDITWFAFFGSAQALFTPAFLGEDLF
jgi:hypothetical protein